ncbi:MAG: serine hydrolase [Dehalococcoidia bacterium]
MLPAARFASLALASFALLPIGVTTGAESSYPQEAAVVSTLALPPGASQPAAVAVNASTGHIYVANAGTDNVSVISGVTGSVIATVPVGRAPRGLAVDPQANRIYVANSGGNDLTVIDGESNKVVATLSAGNVPSDIATDPNTGRVFVTNRGSGTLSVIAGRNNLVIGTVSIGFVPTGVAVNPDTGRVYVASSGSGQLLVVDAVSNLPLATVPLAGGSPGEAWDVAVDSSSNRVYVASSAAEADDADGGTILVIDGTNNSLIGSVTIPGSAEALAVDSASGRIYAGGASDDRLWVIDGHTNTVTAAVGLAGGLSAVAIDSTAGRVYAAHADAGSISTVSWMFGITLASGWSYACYLGDERSPDDALGVARDHVLAVYRLRSDGGYDRWFSGRPDLSTIATVRPAEVLFVLTDDYVPWVQEPSSLSGEFTLASGWNSICYLGESKEAALALGEMSDQIAVAYGLAAGGTWQRFIPARPELSTMDYLRSFSPLVVLIPIQQPPEEEPPKEVSPEFFALQAALENEIRNYYGSVAICVTDLQTDERICVNGDAPHKTGCTINMFSLFVAVEQFQAGRANPADWAYWIKIGIGHSSPPQVAVFVQGIMGSLEAGVKRGRELMQSWGMKDSIFTHLPGYLGQEPGDNVLTASETNMILAKLYRGELFSPEWTAYTIDRLLDIKPGLNYVLPLFLPAGVRVAHKIGYFQDWDGWVYNDVGIVMMQQGDQQIAYAISYLSQAMPTEYTAYIFGAQLSKIVYDWFDQRY